MRLHAARSDTARAGEMCVLAVLAVWRMASFAPRQAVAKTNAGWGVIVLVPGRR